MQFDHLLQLEQIPWLMMIYKIRVQAKGRVEIGCRVAQLNKLRPGSAFYARNHYAANAGIPGVLQHFPAVLIEFIEVQVAVGID